VIRNGKYWKFENKMRGDKKPFGDLVEGDILASNLWPGIHFPGGSSHNKIAFIMVYANKWAQWKPADDTNSGLKDVNDEPIADESEGSDEPQGDDNDSGALINLDDKRGLFAKIRGNEVCYVIIEDNKLYWDQKCKPLYEDKSNYPVNSIAVIKGRDRMWYFFNKEGKYCKRPDKANTKVTVFSVKIMLSVLL
jgi:hypothetical protein